MKDFFAETIGSSLKDFAFVGLFRMEDVWEDEEEERDGPVSSK